MGSTKSTNGMEKSRGNRKKHKKVAMIGHKRIPSREGGVEIVVDELSTRLAAQGYQVDAYNRSGYHVSGKEYDEKRGKSYRGVRLITIPTFQNKKLNAIVYSFLATVRALFGRYDVIHYHAEGPCVMLWIPKLFGVRVIATIHGLDWQRSKWGNFASYILKLGEKVAARYADEIVVLSKNVQDYFAETYKRTTVYIPNGVNLPEKYGAEIIREKYGLEEDGYILFVARIVPEKGIHYLIDAFYRIQTDKKLVIAGGSSHSPEYRDKIRAMAKKDGRIILTGFVQGKELAELYSNAAVFVLPSDVEGMAISLLEAMSYGNCCLVSDIEENTEVTLDKAETFRRGDVKDLRKKLVYLLENGEIREEYKRNSQSYICGKYGWDEVVQRTVELYGKQGRK